MQRVICASNGPNHLGLSALQVVIALEARFVETADGAGPQQHGLSANTMARITSDCGAMRFLSTTRP